MKVREVMQQALVMIAPDAPVRAAAVLMRSCQVNHLVMTDGQDQLIGVLTDRDLKHSPFLPFPGATPPVRRAVLASATSPRRHDLSSRDDRGGRRSRAGLLMLEQRIGSLPVIDRGRLVGIVTERTILEAFRAGTERPDPAELYLG
jgi:CBS domain-containing protein